MFFNQFKQQWSFKWRKQDFITYAYEKIIQRDDIDPDYIAITGISFGGSLLLNSVFDQRMKNPSPKSLMVYGAAFDMNTGFNFLLTGEIDYNNKKINSTYKFFHFQKIYF